MKWLKALLVLLWIVLIPTLFFVGCADRENNPANSTAVNDVVDGKETKYVASMTYFVEQDHAWISINGPVGYDTTIVHDPDCLVEDLLNAMEADYRFQLKKETYNGLYPENR